MMRTGAPFAAIRAAIIDLDGTMVDTALDFHAAVNHVREDFSLAPLDIEAVRQFVGRGFRYLVRNVMALDWNEDQLTRFIPDAEASFLKHYEAVNGQWSKLYPEVAEGLEKMRDKGLRLACVTNKQALFSIPLLHKMGIHPCFEVIYCGDTLPKMKPDPMQMTAVFKDFELAPHEVVAIGDSTNDSLAARAAGCPVLSVSYGYNYGRPVQEMDSDGIVQSLLEAAHLIR